MTTSRLFILCLLLAFALIASPQVMHNRVRSAIRDVFSPGVSLASVTQYAAAQQLRQQLLGDDAHELAEQLTDLRAKLAEAQTQLRREQLAHQQTRDVKLLALQRHDESHKPLDSPPLIVPQIVEARVIGEELAASWRSGKLLNRGTSSGVVEASFVLDANANLVDQGSDAGLSADLPVFAGSCIVGKLQHVGHWSSTWVPLTDKRFRGRARLARLTSAGLIFAAEGVLIGTGKDNCSLTKIRSTEPVSDGDEVFSLETPGGFESPLFYGTVTRAELTPGATHWDIDVRPALDPHSAKSVRIVRPAVNERRLSEKEVHDGVRG